MFGLMNDNTHQRFVSLHGFFALSYPLTWQTETDEAGHYLFYNNQGGQGVLRVMVLPNNFEGDDAERLMFNEIVTQNKSFSPEVYATQNGRFIAYSKLHSINQQEFVVFYWATVKSDKVVLLALTQQENMKLLPVSLNEKETTEQIVASFEFLSE